ncbi:hypothetical protein PanWU01x14_110020, partial [Parasponia andersonii]
KEERPQHNSWKLACGKLDENRVNDALSGRLLQGGHVFQQNFPIRSYELCSDCKMSIGALFNLLHVINKWWINKNILINRVTS